MCALPAQPRVAPWRPSTQTPAFHTTVKNMNKRLNVVVKRHRSPCALLYLKPPPGDIKGVRDCLPKGAGDGPAAQAGEDGEVPLVPQACTGGGEGGGRSGSRWRGGEVREQGGHREGVLRARQACTQGEGGVVSPPQYNSLQLLTVVLE